MSAESHTPAGGSSSRRALPRALGDYELLERLGMGGMGIVYRARVLNSETPVALKTLRFLAPTALYRFKREFRVVCDLEHPNLVKLHDLVCEDGEWFFTMELVEGVDFLAYVRGDGPVDEPLTSESQLARLRDVAGQIARALVALHDLGIVHRDVKPSNIVVTRDGRAVLLDFGLAVGPRKADEASAPVVVGTAAYMAPEQAAAHQPIPASDCYSLGVLIYEALTGAVPFAGPFLEVLTRKQTNVPTPVRAFAPNVPEALNRLCEKLLRVEPPARPSARIIERILRGGGKDSEIRTTASRGEGALFVGRGGELAQLEASLAHVESGTTAAVFVRGESGVGKSALVSHFIETLTASRPEVLVLTGRCTQREHVPYKTLDGVIDSLSHHLAGIDQQDLASLLPRDAALIARLFPVLGRVPAISRARRVRLGADAYQLRLRSVAALRELVVRLARQAPVVLFIDDFQWADPEGVALLGEILHSPDSPRLMVVTTVREQTGGLRQIDDLSAEVAHVHSIDLPVLDETTAEDIARRLLRLHGIESPLAAAAVAREAAGHPLFITELVHHVARTDEVASLTGKLETALAERIAGLDEGARSLLEIVTLAGAPLALDTACRAADISQGDGARVATLLHLGHFTRAQAARGGQALEPFHDRVADAVVSQLDPHKRQLIHRRIADALQATGAARLQPQLLLRHIELAGLEDRASTLALHAARQARDAFAFGKAVELYRAVVERPRGDVDVREVQFELAEALTNAGRGFDSAELYTQLAEDADPAVRLQCLRRAGEQFMLSGHLSRGNEVLGLVIVDAGLRVPSTPRRALASIVWNRARLRMSRMKWRSRHESEIPPRELDRLDLCRALGTSLSVVDNIRGAAFQTRALSMALRTGEPTRVGRAIAMEAMTVGVLGGTKFARAETLVGVAEAIASDTGDPYVRGYVLTAQALLHHFRGNFERSAAGLSEAEQWLFENTVGTAWELGTVRMFRLFAMQQLGTFGDLRVRWDWLLRDARKRGDMYVEATLVRSFYQVWLVEDDLDEATRQLDRLTWAPPDHGYHLQHFYLLRARISMELYAGGGETLREDERSSFEAAKRSLILRVLLPRLDHAWLLARLALVEVASGADPRSRWRLATRWARGMMGEGVCHGTVRAMLVLGTVAYQRGDDTEADACLRRAQSMADDSGLRFHSAVARRCRGIALGGADGVAQTGAAEASMTQLGVRNPQAMSRIFAPGMTRR